MLQNEVYSVLTLIANDKYIRLSAITVICIAVFNATFLSPFIGLVIAGNYILGYVLCWFFLKYQVAASGYLLSLVTYWYGGYKVDRKLPKSCSICEDLSCRRHQEPSRVSWPDLYISKELNDALEGFYTRILGSFVSAWYADLTDDCDFLNELKHCLRYASGAVITRFLELDHAGLLAKKLLPCIVKHIDDYLYMQQITKLRSTRLSEVIVEYLGQRLHIATTSRANELKYLRSLAVHLQPFLLPSNYLKSGNCSILIREILAGWVFLPLTDVLADPGILNSLVVLGATHRAKRGHSKLVKENVKFLGGFVKMEHKSSTFATDLNTIKGDTQLLYAFMQFLKKEEHVHLLQFCLDVDEFNNKLLIPELSKKQLEELHTEAMSLYREYLNRDSISFIDCPPDVINAYYALINDGVHNVAKLRTSKPLFQAYECAFAVLETAWLPAFFHSNEFYGHLCGEKITAAYTKSARNRSRRYYEPPNQGTVAKISSGIGKIKNVLKTAQPIDGAMFPAENHIENGTVDDILISECGNIFRDLSAWRISILSYQSANKVVSFCINVQRLDVVDDINKRHWVILRKDHDFYTLKAKLVEFHGESEICDSPLPSRKAGSSIDVRMSKYEEFLKKLLQKPSLRGSDLLYSFLTAEEDFTALIANTQNQQDLGNIYQSVAHKLRKEKGQNLDSFLGTFLQSTGRAKLGKFEWAEIGDEDRLTSIASDSARPLPKTYNNPVFNDNFGVGARVNDSASSSFSPTGVVQCIFYLLKYVFKAPACVLRLYAAVSSVALDAVEALISLFIERKLRSNLSAGNLAHLVQLLEDVVFKPYTAPSQEELEERRLRAFAEVRNLLPSFTGTLFGDGFVTLLEIVQQPHYNKQLVYNLLDLILGEMYPALQHA